MNIYVVTQRFILHFFYKMNDKERSAELKKLGNRIKQLRIVKGYTSYEPFAYEHKLPRAQFGRYERGENITYINLLKVCAAFEISIHDFFSEGFD